MSATRRSVVQAMAATTAVAATGAKASALRQGLATKRRWDAIVVGAGVFGAWTAMHLQRAGKKVLLLDGRGPASARASSGGETRMIRSDYGADEIYTRMSTASLKEWKALSDRASLPLFHQTGVLFFFNQMVDYAAASIETHKRLKLPLEVLDNTALRKAFPQFDFSGIEFGLYEEGFGALMARRSVQHVVAEFVAAGGSYRQAEAAAPETDGHSITIGGRKESADSILYACGPWMKKLFPSLLQDKLFITRQEVAFVAPPAGNSAFSLGSLPGWADYNNGDLFYGFPDIESRGFKLAFDRHGETFDPDTGDRRTAEASFDRLRHYLAMRFPALADAPFVGDRVCQYTNSSNGDFLIDRHPEHKNIILVGAGSGHGFKHGPEVGRQAAGLALDLDIQSADRFQLSTKESHHNRTVV
jgi:sarcosine oxidase